MSQLYIPNPDQSTASFYGRNIGDIDTTHDSMHREKEHGDCLKRDDYPSLSERVVIGQEVEKEVGAGFSFKDLFNVAVIIYNTVH